MDNRKRVAIVGSGFSGLTTLKHILEQNVLVPIVLEKREKLGGVWSPNSKCLWRGLHANTSHYAMSHTDFRWKSSTPIYPSADQVTEYLQEYAHKFDLEKYIKYNSSIQHVTQQCDKWKIKWTNSVSNTDCEDTFDFLIIATGMYTSPYIPETYKDMNNFKGQIIHSQNYHTLKENGGLNGKKIIVYGHSISAVEIAADLAEQGAKICNIFKRPRWVFPKMIKIGENKKLPSDLVFFNRKQSELTKALKGTVEANMMKNQLMSNMCHEQNKYPDLYIDPNSNDPPRIAFSENYMDCIKQEKIIPKRRIIKMFYENGVILDDEQMIEADIIIFCTGFYSNLNYFEKEILDKLEYDQFNQTIPLILYKGTFHPDIPNLAFVGIVHFTFLLFTEIQAKWISLVFSEKLYLHWTEKEKNALEKEREFRKAGFRKSRVELQTSTDEIAQEINILPDLEKLKNTDQKLHKCLFEGPALAAHYLVQTNDKDKRDEALKFIHEVNEFVSKV